MQGGCRAGARARRTDEQVSELTQALECRGPLRPSTLVGRVEGRCDGTVVRDVDGGVGKQVERACGLAGLLAAERRQVELRLGAQGHAWAQAQVQVVCTARACVAEAWVADACGAEAWGAEAWGAEAWGAEAWVAEAWGAEGCVHGAKGW